MLGYYLFSVSDLMGKPSREPDRIDHREAVAAQRVARDWIDQRSGPLQRRWRNDALALATSGVVPLFGHVVFGWSILGMIVAFGVDLATAWFWDIVKMIGARRTCEIEVRALLDAEQALRIARAARARPHGAGAIVVPKKRAVDEQVRSFRIGYALLAMVALVPVSVLLAYGIVDARFDLPHPLWPVFVPVLVRSAQAIADLLATRSASATNPQVLPQALDPTIAVAFTGLVMFGVFEHVHGFVSSPIAWACVYALAAISVATLLLRQMRRSRETLAWFAAADPATMARPDS